MAKISGPAADLALDEITALLDGGTIEVRDGTPPANVAASATGTVLATLTFDNPAFGASSGGVATAAAIVGDSSADATGTASYARLKASGGTAHVQVTVSAVGGGGELQFSTVAFASGVPVNITSCILRMPL